MSGPSSPLSGHAVPSGDGIGARVSLGSESEHSGEDDTARDFALSVAVRMRSIADPRTVLDAGCARGLLVRAFRTLGVDAVGVDVSEVAIKTSHDDVRPHLRIGTLTEPLGGPFDLVTCIEVLEHVGDSEAQAIIDRMCAVTDLILLSSPPRLFDEPSHVNVRPTADWVAEFAERGFYRRTDVGLDFLAPWAVLFARSDLSTREVVHRYESQYAALHDEVLEKRRALLESHRLLTEQRAGDPIEAEVGTRALLRELQEENDVLAGRAVAAEQQTLRMRDHVIGLEATAGTQTRLVRQARAKTASQRERIGNLQAKVERLRTRAADLERRARVQERRATQLAQELKAMTDSRTWRWARRMSRPLRRQR